MVNIELTLEQAEELKNFYSSELEKIQKREIEIRDLLVKFNGNQSVKISLEPNQEKEPVLNKEAIEANPRWTGFIIQILKEKQKPLFRKTIIKLYEEQNNLNVSSSKKAMSSLAQALYLLSTKKNEIQIIKKKGKKERLYGLTEWADKSIAIAEPEKNPEEKSVIKPVKKRLIDTSHNWPKFIIDTLDHHKRVMQTKELINYAITAFDIPANEVTKTRNSISPTLSYLELKTKTLKTVIKKGQKPRSYGLSNWFNDEGELIADYK